MSSRKQRAKQLLKDKKFIEAKELILQIINDGDSHYKLFEKLGAISDELDQYQDALRYYKKSMQKNQANPFIYIKIGNLYHEHFSNNNKAQEMYEKCIKLQPNNELCWFNYGKLMKKQKNFSKAEQCYLRCTTPRSCVYYHHALLLLSNPSSNTKQTQRKILDLLSKAANLQPNVLRYQHQYALCLQNIEETEDDQCRNIHIQSEPKKENIDKQYVHSDRDENIKLIIYDFDQTITYNNLYTKVHGDVNKLKYMRKMDLINNVFGGDDRLNRLHLHFKRVLSSPNNVRLAILSFNHTNIIIEALGRIGLMKYFSNIDIIGSDISKYLNQTKSKLKDIIAFANDYKLSPMQMLLVDDKQENTEQVANDCITYHIFSNYPLNGLSMVHMKKIEELLGVYAVDDYDIAIPEQILSTSIKQINPSIYRSIKSEIANMSNYDSIDALSVVKWIRQNWKTETYKDHFLYFAKIFKRIRNTKPKGSDWTMANMLPLLLEIVPTESEIQRRYAKCLAFLGHYNESENYYKMAVGNSRHYLHRLEYAYFLFKQQRYPEAEQYFMECLGKYMNDIKGKSRVYLGYARTLEHLNKMDKAEKYFKLCIESTNKRYDDVSLMYTFYGVFLYERGRYQDAKQQFESGLAENDRNANNHYAFSKVLLKLNMLDEYEWHLKRVLELDSNFEDAKIALNRYYQEMDNQHSQQQKKYNEYDDEKRNEYDYNDSNMCHDSYIDEKKENLSMKISSLQSTGVSVDDRLDVVGNVYAVEFDRFWFDGINILTDSFNHYYDEFVRNDLNDIRCILFDEYIENKLQHKIGVNVLRDLQIIMTEIHHLQNQHKEFVNKLNQRNMEDFYAMFAHNGIYTINSLRQKIKTEQDIRRMLIYYNNDKQNDTKQFNVNDNGLLRSLWNFVCKN